MAPGTKRLLPENITLRTLVVDDHAVVRKGVIGLLEEAFDHVAAEEAASAMEATRRMFDEDWNAVILDISLPGRSGLDVLKDFRDSRPEIPVLILSMFPEDQYGPRALKAGAAGYVCKERIADDLQEAFKRIIAGKKYIGPELAEQLALQINEEHIDAPHEGLSDREYEVMTLIASGKTVGEIAEQLSLSPKTISTYRARVLDKMKMDNNAELTTYAIARGLTVVETIDGGNEATVPRATPA